jgi:hypothetical protein
MMTLAEIMQSAQGGNAMTNLANQFGLAPAQAQQAVQAVLPAISLGLQQQAQTIDGWQNILSTLGQSQNSAAFIDSDGDGIPDHLEQEGHAALGNLFGTQQMTQAVANQAAQFAGIPANLMQQMMPAIAAMVMGGLLKGATNHGLGGLIGQMMQGGMQQAGNGGLGGMLGGLLGQMMQPQAQQPANNGMAGGLGGLLGPLMGAFTGQNQPAPQQSAGGLLGGLMNAMLGGAQPQPQAPATPVQQGLEALQNMFKAGNQMQGAQVQAFQNLFEQHRK